MKTWNHSGIFGSFFVVEEHFFSPKTYNEFKHHGSIYVFIFFWSSCAWRLIPSVTLWLSCLRYSFTPPFLLWKVLAGMLYCTNLLASGGFQTYHLVSSWKSITFNLGVRKELKCDKVLSIILQLQFSCYGTINVSIFPNQTWKNWRSPFVFFLC